MPELSIEGVGRSYGAVRALQDVSLTIASGEVHALMGENGAGKSTLIRLIAGLERPDTGEIAQSGRGRLTNPAEVHRAGLRFIHQELHAVAGVSVAENMHLDHAYPTRYGLVDWRALNAAAKSALDRLGCGDIDPRMPMTSLSVGDQMIVRIAATLISDGGAPPWLYFMDEPTAALSGAESERLFSVIGDLVRQGAGILYVSHRLPEVLRLSARVTILRDGRHISTRRIEETNRDRLIEEMTGRDMSGLFPPKPEETKQRVLLQAEGLTAPGFTDVSFELKSGEVLGVAGLAGSGRGALLRALAGGTRSGGSVSLDSTALAKTPKAVWSQGVAYVPRERRAEGLMMGRSITENVVLPHLSGLSHLGVVLSPKRNRQITQRLGQDVRLKADSLHDPVAALSGGNQQKALFARALAGRPRLVLLDEPTRGVDVGAKHDLYQLIRNIAAAGAGIMLASSDLPELLGMTDRILILRDRRLGEIVETEGLAEADLLARFYHQGETAA